MAAAAGTGAALGGICGFLKKKSGADELLTTFLLSASVSPILDALVGGVFRDKGGNLLASAKFPPFLVLPKILLPSNLSVSFVIAPLFVVLFAVFLSRTAAGYRFLAAGAAPQFARFGGIDPRRMIVPALAAGAALHGLAGFFLCAGSAGRLHLGFPGGMGWNAIAAALLAGKRPLLLIPVAALFCAALAVSDNALLLYGLRLESKRFIEAFLLLIAASIRPKSRDSGGQGV
jgi:simple sugar transport system permease protein